MGKSQCCSKSAGVIAVPCNFDGSASCCLSHTLLALVNVHTLHLAAACQCASYVHLVVGDVRGPTDNSPIISLVLVPDHLGASCWKKWGLAAADMHLCAKCRPNDVTYSQKLPTDLAGGSTAAIALSWRLNVWRHTAHKCTWQQHCSWYKAAAGAVMTHG